ACQGFYWWEIDITYYILKVMSWTGLVWDLRTPPRHVRDQVPRDKGDDTRLPVPEVVAPVSKATTGEA
ncbi:MAG: hypothetical protein AAGC55_25185, partial [Myxococcota bacterium]